MAKISSLGRSWIVAMTLGVYSGCCEVGDYWSRVRVEDCMFINIWSCSKTMGRSLTPVFDTYQMPE